MKKNLLLFSILFILVLDLSAQKTGSKVKVLDFGSWISGTLIGTKDGQYLVHFDDKYYKDKLVKEKDIVFVDNVNPKPVRDTVYLTKYKTDTVYITKASTKTIETLKEDTIYKTIIDTVLITQRKKDTVYVYKRDTITISRTKRDTVFSYKRDTISISKTLRDTIFKIKRDTVVINRTIKDTVINTKTETITPPEKVNTFKVGDLVQVFWNNSWFPASVLEIKGEELYKIRYDGYSSGWDEVVGKDRIKKR